MMTKIWDVIVNAAAWPAQTTAFENVSGWPVLVSHREAGSLECLPAGTSPRSGQPGWLLICTQRTMGFEYLPKHGERGLSDAILVDEALGAFA